MKLITIDGPSASGKTSVSRELAHRLHWKWVSTGTFYRGIGYLALLRGVDTSNENSLEKMIAGPGWSITLDEDLTRFYAEEKDVTDEILKEKIGIIASEISRFPKVRAALLKAQRDCYKSSVGLVAEGRDCGSVVFPEAPLKIYLTARSEARAERRALQTGSKAEDVVERQNARDQMDSGRVVAPLAVPTGGVVLDTSTLNFEQVISRILELTKPLFK